MIRLLTTPIYDCNQIPRDLRIESNPIETADQSSRCFSLLTLHMKL